MANQATLRRGTRILGWVGLATLLPVFLSAARVLSAANGGQYSVQDVDARPVGLVLGAHANPGSPSRFLAARLDVALDLFTAGKVRVLLVSGDGHAASNYETAVMKQYLVDRGVPAEKIVEDIAGYDTYDSCWRAKKVFGIDRLTIISQDFHLPRAITICRALGIDAVGVADHRMRRASPGTWAGCVARELLANVKMAWDVGTARPAREPDVPSSAVTKALNS